VLAVTGRQRAPSAPNVPTVKEAGYPALEMESLGGLFGPRGMLLAVRQQISADVKAAVASDPTIETRLNSTGQISDVRGPAEFAAGVKELQDKLAELAKVLGMKAATQ
jgi:tripartite-type tricarboxylate transporter receptor subunit TctC